jgi:fucose permease
MWSIIFALALNSVSEHHGSFAGILCTGILGGALVPLVIGWLGDHIGLRDAMFLILLLLTYIISIGFWARPLTRNETIWNHKVAKEAPTPLVRPSQT